MVHGIKSVIAELSGGMTLRAGTIIATGTPAAWAWASRRPLSEAGDVVAMRH
jgi:2-keto-4-pentenoate hydratase/2-oxohepta-3-ene-1,7-dioic acid hydratase in catechol pathway